MALPSSGQLGFSSIAGELSISLSNVSLRNMSSTAGFSTPDYVSEFYGYSNAVSTIPLYIYLFSFYSTGQGYENSNYFSVYDYIDGIDVYYQSNILGVPSWDLDATVDLTPGHEYGLSGFADETFQNSYVEINWHIMDPDDSYTQTYYDYGSYQGYGYEYQDILMANPIPGTSQGFLEIYGSLDFF